MNDKKLDRIAERVYNASFILVALVILAATVGSIFASYTLGQNITLVSDNVFKFIEYTLSVFVLPITAKIAGDSLPHIARIIFALKGIEIHTVETGFRPVSTYGNVTQFGNTTTYPPTGEGANPNTYY